MIQSFIPSRTVNNRVAPKIVIFRYGRNYSIIVSVSYGCFNKLPKTWLKNTNLSSYHFGGQKSEVSISGVKSRCWQGHTPPGGSRRKLCLAFSSFLLWLAILWFVAESLQSLRHFQISLCSLFKYLLLFYVCVRYFSPASLL